MSPRLLLNELRYEKQQQQTSEWRSGEWLFVPTLQKFQEKKKKVWKKHTHLALKQFWFFFFISLLISQGGERLGAFNQIVLRLAKKTGGNNRMHKTAAGGGGKQTPTKKPDDALARLQVWTLLPGEYFLLNVGAGRRPFEIFFFFYLNFRATVEFCLLPMVQACQIIKEKIVKKKKKLKENTLKGTSHAPGL